MRVIPDVGKGDGSRRNTATLMGLGFIGNVNRGKINTSQAGNKLSADYFDRELAHVNRDRMSVPGKGKSVEHTPRVSIQDCGHLITSTETTMTNLSILEDDIVVHNTYSDEFADIPLMDKDKIHECQRDGCTRVVINVSGMYFETIERTLWRLPDTLLGDPDKLLPYWDDKRQEYFFDRHRPSFQAILYFYQSGGNLKRPLEVPADVFIDELRFFQFSESIIKRFLKTEGYIIDEKIDRPISTTKRLIWDTFEGNSRSPAAKMLSMLSITTILLSVVSFCAETVPSIKQDYGCLRLIRNGTDNETDIVFREKHTLENPFFVIETICIAFFTFEYLFRLFSCPCKWRFLLKFLNIIDLIAILPFYIFVSLSMAMRDHPERCVFQHTASMFAILRAIRIVRIFKLVKHFKGLQVLAMTMRDSFREFMMFCTFFLLTMLIFASLVYQCESQEPGSKFTSIPDTCWYVVITMTTVGYGDVVPVTVCGRVIGSLCVISGVLVLAIPVPVIVTNFTNYYNLATGRHSPLDP